MMRKQITKPLDLVVGLAVNEQAYGIAAGLFCVMVAALFEPVKP